MSNHTPGPDKRGNYWFDCGCMINGVQQQRCPLHHAAPDLLAALEAALPAIDCVAEEIAQEARAAIAQAKGEE